jgi:hypothetical protein
MRTLALLVSAAIEIGAVARPLRSLNLRID